MAVTLPNLDEVQKTDPKAGEALQKVQNKLNQGVSGNKVAPPSGFVNPGQRPG